ncbi:PRC-barrel domain-containing protein [Paraburkholderia sp. LEh10]|jgi:sporulation protein YlmC with PRC-barrel domain|uniref:PRC-barrel domain-containing protein n=1 Tax=Paraburkholderia sp. LEh10 TaxID=2821353 RepID=UPI001AE68DC9|nr:PRC-barrel domain-containing protein [Paraburkholderia sp. LEh10]MBP0589994.1 PRC-barrel domain-containing protein [Paraburkholderia sp. LEh10]
MTMQKQTAGADIVGARSGRPSGPGPYVMAANTLDGDRVLSADGQDIGKIKDIMLDVRSGRIAYAVLSSGGFLGLGDKLLAIPWSALTLDIDRQCFMLDMPGESVKNAPGFDKDHWPSMADPTWATSVHQYYGREPYWGTSGSTSGSTGMSSGAGTDEFGAGDITPGSSDAPEAGGVKL